MKSHSKLLDYTGGFNKTFLVSLSLYWLLSTPVPPHFFFILIMSSSIRPPFSKLLSAPSLSLFFSLHLVSIMVAAASFPSISPHLSAFSSSCSLFLSVCALIVSKSLSLSLSLFSTHAHHFKKLTYIYTYIYEPHFILVSAFDYSSQHCLSLPLCFSVCAEHLFGRQPLPLPFQFTYRRERQEV